VGTSSDPIVFTSINDPSVGGATGSGDPLPGDWAGIGGTTTASLDVSHATIEYSGNGSDNPPGEGDPAAIDVSGGSNSTIVVNNDTFNDNYTGVSVSAAVGTNASITNNTFDSGNTYSINAESNWEPATVGEIPCAYLPTMTATGNTFYQEGSSSGSSPDPLVSSSDYFFIQAASADEDSSPEGWTDNIEMGSSDVLTSSTWNALLPCDDALDPENAWFEVATPLNWS
jgi:hypothetical protein